MKDDGSPENVTPNDAPALGQEGFGSRLLSEIKQVMKEQADENEQARLKKLDENKHIAAFKTYHLAHDEQIISWSPALRQNDVFEGIAVLTDRRFVYYRSGLLTEAIEPWPLSKINSIEARKGLLWYSLKLFTGNDVLSLTSNEKVACERVARHLQIAVGMINDGLYDDLDDDFEDDDEADAGAGDLVELLHKLDDLKKKGILTEEEFAQKKAEILARI